MSRRLMRRRGVELVKVLADIFQVLNAGDPQHPMCEIGATFAPAAHPVGACTEGAKRAFLTRFSIQAGVVSPAVGAVVFVSFLSLHRRFPFHR